jgi:uncharacterized protein YraI
MVDQLHVHLVHLVLASALALSVFGVSFLAAPSSASAASSATTTVYLNLRSGPSLGYRVITVMPPGSPVGIRGPEQGGWYPVTYNGVDGWAYGIYLSLGNGGAQVASYTPSSSSVSTGNSIVDIINAAAARYGQSGAVMLRVARCESGLNPNAVNRRSGASGLFQFLPSTWRTTPYAGYSVFDPWANANAAGWMWSVGRRGEWVCQ